MYLVAMAILVLRWWWAASQISSIISWSVAVLHLHELDCAQPCSVDARLSAAAIWDDDDALVAAEPVAVCHWVS